MPSQPAGTIRMIDTGTFKDAVFSPDGTIIYASHAGILTAYNVSSGITIGNWALGTRLGGIDISTDGHTLVATELQAGPTVVNGGTSTTDYYVYKLDTTSGTKTTFTAHMTGFSQGYYDASMLSNGQALLSQTSQWEAVTALDLTSGTFTKATTETFAESPVLVATADRSHVLIAAQDTSDAPLAIYTVGSGITATHGLYADGVSGYNNGVEAISPTGNLVGQWGLNIYDGNLHFLIDLQRLYPEIGTHVSGMAFSLNGDAIYLLDSGSKTVVELETATWGVVRQFSVETDIAPPGGSFGNVLQLSPDGHMLSVLGSAGLELINLSTVVPNGATAGNDSLTGTPFGDVMFGFGGNDTIDGGAGADTMWGGAGNDAFYVDNVNDVVEDFDPTGGQDTIYSSVSYYTGSIEALVLTGNAVNASGGGGNDWLQGDDVNNGLTGDSGNDTLLGAGGNDNISGGEGDDSIRGGTGTDYLYSGLGNDTLTGGTGDDVFGGTVAELSGDTITDLSAGDRVTVFGADYASLTYGRGDGFLKLGTAPIWIGGAPVRFVTETGAGYQMVDLVAANRMTGLGDFNGDGHSDILWRHTNGSVSTWQVTGNSAGSQLQAAVFNGHVDSGWTIGETLDYNGDGVSDILWRHSNGALSIWAGDGQGGFTAGFDNSSVGGDWRVAAAGDFNGDGKDDLLWQKDDGSIQIWQANGTGFTANAYSHVSVGTSWHVDGAADFNGDGRSDILWRNDSGAISIWRSDETGAPAAQFETMVGNDWHIAGLGDFNGDGMSDIVWRRFDGALTIWRSNGDGFDQAAYNDMVGTDWHVAAVGDFNDDGKADLLWRNDNGWISTWESNGSGFREAVANGYASPGWSVSGHIFLA